MIRHLPVTELGQRRPSFTHPDVPPPVAVGKCSKCGGNTRAEEFDSWKGGEYARKRTYRCIQHGTRCPSKTVIVGEEEKAMAKAKPKIVACLQDEAWCVDIKARIVKKALSYEEVAKAAGISKSALAQGLNMHMSLSPVTQERLEKVIAEADAAQAQKTRKERSCRKPKGTLPPSLQGPPTERVSEWADQMEKETMEQVVSNLAALEALPPGATVTWSESPLTGPQVALYCAEESGFPPPRGYESWDDFKQKGGRLLDGVDAMAERALDLVCDLKQQHKAMEARAEERFTAFAQGHQIHEDRLCRLEDARVELEDRITQTYDHLTESMANMQPLVVSPPSEPDGFAPGSPFARPSALEGLRTSTIDEDSLKWWIDERDQPLTPDKLVKELSLYSDSQLAAMVAAAAARREMFKALEAA